MNTILELLASKVVDTVWMEVPQESVDAVIDAEDEDDDDDEEEYYEYCFCKEGLNFSLLLAHRMYRHSQSRQNHCLVFNCIYLILAILLMSLPHDSSALDTIKIIIWKAQGVPQ